LFDWFVKCQKIFGHETYEISVPTLPPGVVINSPDVLEYVLKHENAITKGEFFRNRSWDLFGTSVTLYCGHCMTLLWSEWLTIVVGYGIINATGELWRAQRKAGMKFFSGANLDIMIEDVLPDVYDKISEEFVDAADSRSVVDLQAIFHDLTTTVVGRMAYDVRNRPLHHT
jgi:hypothetical protein